MYKKYVVVYTIKDFTLNPMTRRVNPMSAIDR